MKYSKQNINSVSAYRTLFSTNPSNLTTDASRAKAALEQALDTRKFEIELYWKRSTYFWIFIAAAFGGFGAIYERAKEGSDHGPMLLLISGIGLIFSFSWILVNKASKFWQLNWERHVDMLDDLVYGPLYKTVLDHDNSRFTALDFNSPFHFSVSRLNQMVSYFITSIWSAFCTLLFGFA